MKVLIEALGIHDYGGGRTATLNLLRHLLSLDKETAYRLVLTRPEPGLRATNLRQIILPLRNRFLARLGAQALVPLLARGSDVVHCAKNLGLLALPAPQIITVYDVSPLLQPALYPRSDVWYWRRVQPFMLRRAAAVIAISQNTARELRHCYPDLPPERAQVIYPSIGARFRPAPAETIAALQQTYRLPENYLLFVGRFDRKNNPALAVEAFARYLKAHPEFVGVLVLVGRYYPKSPAGDLTAAIRAHGLEHRVRHIEPLPDEDLPALYSGARAVLLPSHHEGFGLVAAEALACGAPLIASRVGALPEVVGEAALLVDDLTPQAFAQAIETVLHDSHLRAFLRNAGPQQVRRFQNDRDAQETLLLYRRVGRM